MAPRRHRGKPSRGILKAAVYGIAAGAVGAFGLHMTKPGLQQPLPPGIDHRVSVLVTPEGNGYCRKVTVSSSDGAMIDARSVLCSSLAARAELPPVLRGYQASLRTP